ncbi:MAG TPA: hypothetical protein VGL65_06695 [Gemmatimonadales bacterium]
MMITFALPLRAQIVATPMSATGAGPRLPRQPASSSVAFPGQSLSRRVMPRRDTYIRVSTLAIVIGVVILVLLLV